MKKKIHITIPEETLEKVKELAREDERNLSNMITVLVQRGIEKSKPLNLA